MWVFQMSFDQRGNYIEYVNGSSLWKVGISALDREKKAFHSCCKSAAWSTIQSESAISEEWDRNFKMAMTA